MHDLAYFRANLDTIAARLATRGTITGLDRFRDLDQRRRAAITEAEELKAKRNAESAAIAQLRKAGEDTSQRQQEVRRIAERIGALNEQIRTLEESFKELMAGFPNVPHESVPVGTGADDNVEVRRWGTPPAFEIG